ncbi:hypothetical protein NXY56_007764 [Leishmania guyanensis]
MQAEDAAQSPPRKKRGVAAAVPTGRDKMTVAALVSVPPSLSSSFPVPPKSCELHTTAKLRPGSKRGRADKRQSSMDGNCQRSSRHHTETTLEDTAAPASSTPSTRTRTNLTLMYNFESPPLPSPPCRNWQDATASPASLVGSIATPARRNGLVLTSTPPFIREERARAAKGDAATHTPSASVSTPMRLVRVARGLLSPASTTLRRRLTHLRRSAVGATRFGQGLQRQQQTAASSVSPPLSSPWGRLSTIMPASHSFPSCMGEGSYGDNASVKAVSRRSGLASSSEPLSDAVELSSIPANQRFSVSVSDTWRRGGHDAELPELLRPTIQLGSVVLDNSSDDAITTSLSRRSSPTVTAVDEVRGVSRLQQRRRVDDDLRAMSGRGDTAALCGPYDVRFAQVSSLSESLADIVSSSRSTAHSSLTSATATSALGAAGQARISSAGRDGAGDTENECLPRRSATMMDINLSSILPDEEELAIRRRLQRSRNCQAPHAQRDRDIHGANVAALEPVRRHPVATRACASNVMELFVTNAPPLAPLGQQLPLRPEVRRLASSRCASGNSASGAGGMAAVASEHQSAASHAHTARVWPPEPQHPFTSPMSSVSSWRTVARVSRRTVALLSALVCVWCVVAVVSPLVALQPRYTFSAVARVDSAAAETHFVQIHTNSVAELQALYQIAPASLSADAVMRLHHRTLSEGVERLERATQHLVPDDSAPPLRRLFYLRAMIRAYLVMSRNCELYARSRDGSRWRRYVVYPLADMKRYGVHRFGTFVGSSTLNPGAAAAWRDRVWTTAMCSAQSEVLACPSVLYVEEAMARDAAQFMYTDVNEAYESPQRKRKLKEWRMCLHRDWGSEVYLETLLSYIRSGVQGLTRDYNR